MREDVRTKQALARLVRHPTVTMKALAAELGVAYRTMANWVEPDGTIPTLAQVRDLVAAAAKLDPEAARELAADLFGLTDSGWLLAAAPRQAPSASDLVGEVLEAGAAVGEVTGWAARATSDGRVDSTEADEGWRAIHKAQRELAEAAAVVEKHRAPQLAWRLPMAVTA